jgi:phthalate 3,4-dioxygenase ferredoxin reductase subunit
VYAVGDVARWWRAAHDEHRRVEHWTSACQQAACVAHNVVHPDERRDYQAPDYVWSDQYDWKIQIVGRPDRCEVHELIGDQDGDPPRFAALYRDDDGGLAGAVTLNWPRALVACRHHLDTGASFAAALDATAGLTQPARAR